MTVIKTLVSVDPVDAYFDISHDLIGLSFDVSYMYITSDGMSGPASCLDEIPTDLLETLGWSFSARDFYFLLAKFE